MTCTYSEALLSDQELELQLAVKVNGLVGGAVNRVSVTGPGSPQASASEPVRVSSAPSLFGVGSVINYLAGSDGQPATQAGGHPYELTTRLGLNSVFRPIPEGLVVEATSVHDLKDVVFDLPLGVVGSAVAAQKCTLTQLASLAHCPPDTRVGQIRTSPLGAGSAYTDVYNIAPEAGVAAEFGFADSLNSTHVIYATAVPDPSDPGQYLLRATTREIPQVGLTHAVITFFGDPVEKDGVGGTPVAMFTNASDCSGEPLQSTVHVDSWQEPGGFLEQEGFPAGEPLLQSPGWVSTSTSEWPAAGGSVSPAVSSAVTGCNELHFQPSSFSFAPEPGHGGADEPAGYESVLTIPQSENPQTLATPPLKTTVVTLPAGTSISPSAADGLVGCREEPGAEEINFQSAGPGHCPAASKVGTVEVQTPVLAERLSEGSVYVAQPTCGGPGQPQCTEALAETGGCSRSTRSCEQALRHLRQAQGQGRSRRCGT